MALMSNYLSNALLGAWLQGTAFTPPANLYFTLLTAPPKAWMTGSSISEPSDEDPLFAQSNPDVAYSRQLLPANTTFWQVLNNATGFGGHQVGSYAVNLTAISFNPPTVAWGRVSWWALCDALTGGNLLLTGNMNPDIIVYRGKFNSNPNLDDSQSIYVTLNNSNQLGNVIISEIGAVVYLNQ